MIARTLAVSAAVFLFACAAEKKEDLQPVAPPNATLDTPPPPPSVTATATAAGVTPASTPTTAVTGATKPTAAPTGTAAKPPAKK